MVVAQRQRRSAHLGPGGSLHSNRHLGTSAQVHPREAWRAYG